MAQTPNQFVEVWEKRKTEAMALLAGSITKIPVRFWDRHMFFVGVDNTWWRQKTSTFPATNFAKGTHPLFVLRKQGSLGVLVCPCSSSGNTKRFIQKGCVLAQTNKHTDRDSYLVEKIRFSLPYSTTFSPQPIFMGTVPWSCIQEAWS